MPKRERAAIERAMEVARRAVKAASRASLAWFDKPLAVRAKDDGTPVTEADLASERAIVAAVRQSFPRARILSEESGLLAGEGGSRWIVDPLDGTMGFSRGGRFWGPLVAFERRGEIVAGAMALPADGIVFWAGRGIGCFRNGARVRLRVAPSWEEATLSLGDLRALFEPPFGPAVLELVRTARRVRSYGDLAGCAMLLTGEADLWLEAGVRVWDLAAASILVEEAGGVFTDLDGVRTIDTGSALAGSPALHARALSVLRARTSGGL